MSSVSGVGMPCYPTKVKSAKKQGVKWGVGLSTVGLVASDLGRMRKFSKQTGFTMKSIINWRRATVKTIKQEAPSVFKKFVSRNLANLAAYALVAGTIGFGIGAIVDAVRNKKAQKIEMA